MGPVHAGAEAGKAGCGNAQHDAAALRRSLDRHRGAPRIGDVADDGKAKAR